MMPFFSVIIPLYNKENFIKDTIHSVIVQSFTDYEIIIINDCSTDNSLKLAKSIFDNRIKIIENDKNYGLSESRNIGINNSNGEIIALLDADDIWLPDYLEQIKLLFDKFPEASIYGTDYLEVFNHDISYSPRKNISNLSKNTYFIIDDFFKASKYQTITCPSCLAFKKNIMIANCFFNPKITFAEDIDFYLRYCSNYKIAYYNGIGMKKKINVPNQITKTKISDKTTPDLNFYEKQFQENESIKIFINLYRYIFAYHLKLENNSKKLKQILNNINYNNLSLKQRVLLAAPRPFVIFLNKFKNLLIKKNIRITSF